MSIYSECSQALVDLQQVPPPDLGGVFSEIDVVNKASKQEWSNNNYKEALRHANQVAGTAYRARKICRYGPVTLPDGSLDYARIASKIAYADVETGPEFFETPNGKFSKMMIENDNIGHQGRREGTKRNDLAPWDEQEFNSAPKQVAPSKNGDIDVTPFERRIRQLEADLNAANKRYEALQRENERLRNHRDGTGEPASDIKAMVEDAVLTVVSDLDERLQRLEQIEEQRHQMYVGRDAA